MSIVNISPVINIYPIRIKGSFDDAQEIVKSLFGDLAFKKDVALSAINSINLARVLAQCVYYLSAHLQLPAGTARHSKEPSGATAKLRSRCGFVG